MRSFSGKKYLNIKIGINPFNKSLIKTIKPYLSPRVIVTFEAPAFPVFTSLISIPLTNLPAIIAGLIEPIV